jgi:tetratricopeptide (TPR) repeat protein
MYRSSLFLTAALMGTTIALVQPMAEAKSVTEVVRTARAVTVEIKLQKDESTGSGVIVDRKGELYTIVTNAHVVCGNQRCSKLPSEESYSLGLADGQQYLVRGSSLRLLGNDLDLAIIQFRSNRNYAVAKLAAPGNLKIDDDVYTAGFPFEQPGFTFGFGQAIAIVNKRLKDNKGDNVDGGGYTIVYNAFTLPGMSGGGVFDGNGQLVAIHGQGDKYKENTNFIADNIVSNEIGSKIGFNRGIPVRWLIQNLAEAGINLGVNNSVSNIRAARAQVPATADEYFIAGFNKYVEPGDNFVSGKQEAIQEFSTAIRLDPRYQHAYFMRAHVYEQVQEFQKSLADLNQAILINPIFISAYINRGILKANKLNDNQGALKDFDQAISINPIFASAYGNRGILKANKLNDNQGALEDYDKAISISPKYASAYYNRANLKVKKLNNNQGALEDYDKAISINPKYAHAYGNRGFLKAYILKDIQGALKDFDKAISINSKDAEAYGNRGFLKAYILKDRTGAIQDLRQAAQLFRDKGNTQDSQRAIGALKELGATE